MMPHELSVCDLTKHYADVVALSGVSFSAAEGQIFGLLGRNGAGKTTAIECIVGLRKPDSGSIHVCGIDAVADSRKVRQIIGVQLQSTALQDKITPREALKLFASFYAQPADVASLIEQFGLAEKADAHFDTLSGGQRQSLALALALVNRPKVLFLDEPTAGLDAHSRRQLHQTIRQVRDEGRTVLLTTHNIQEAGDLCDRIAILETGRIAAEGTPGELIGRAAELGCPPSLEDVFIKLTGGGR
jgi:ABC-2 type transport system ATP-binding protein